MSQFLNPAAVRSAGVLGRVTKTQAQARFMATVQHNTARQVPTPHRKATPISTERATFTIKVCTSELASPMRYLPPLRMGQFFPENRLALRPISLVRPFSPPPSLDTLNL